MGRHLRGAECELLGALPQRSWLKRLRRVGVEVLEPLWRHVHDKNPATQSRWQWTGVWDDAVCHQYGEQLRVVGTWWSGQQKRGWSGIAGLWLLVGVGAGRVVVPVDVAMRRPDPVGPGAPCSRRSWGSEGQPLGVHDKRAQALAAGLDRAWPEFIKKWRKQR